MIIIPFVIEFMGLVCLVGGALFESWLLRCWATGMISFNLWCGCTMAGKSAGDGILKVLGLMVW